MIFLSSLYFYAWWDWRFLSLILLTIAVGFFAAIGLETSKNNKKAILFASITFMLGVLGYFKYAKFFIESFIALLNGLGAEGSAPSLNIILPIGISFYTFQVISYLVDVRRGIIRAERNFITFGAFVCFFPQLVAGPIERASHLLLQFNQERSLNRAMVSKALYLVLIGYFFKVGIADVLAPSVEQAFVDGQPSGWWTILGTYAFAIQIYGDFLGYSLIAKGVALLFGIELIWNFNFPYWSTSIIDFWRRWHISLSRWLRDYLYFTLGGSKGTQFQTIRNLLITMVLGGLWHGASWTFVLWGLLHGVALGLNHIWRSFVSDRQSSKLLGWFVTFCIVLMGWFLFRVRSLQQAQDMLSALGNLEWFPAHTGLSITLLSFSLIIAVFEFVQLKTNDRYFLLSCGRFVRTGILSALVFYIWIVQGLSETTFIYFQF